MQEVGRVFVVRRQWLQQVQPFLRHFLETIGNGKYPLCLNSIGIRFQDLLRLLLSQSGIVGEEIVRIPESDFYRCQVGSIGYRHERDCPQ